MRTISRLATFTITAALLTGCSYINEAKNYTNEHLITNPQATTSDLTPIKDVTVDIAATQQQLASLTIAPQSPKPYNRKSMYGAPWDYYADGTKRVGRGSCNTRDEILARDLTNPVIDTDGCKVLSGTLIEPYTGKTIQYTRGLSEDGGNSDELPIDHIVALNEANQSGGYELDQQTRQALANDPLNLIVSDRSENSDKKKDKDAAGYIPANPNFQCKTNLECN